MKKKFITKILIVTSVLLGWFFVNSCSSDDGYLAPTLSLSEKSYTFPKSASEKVIKVTTNQPKWTSIASAEWVELIQAEKELTIKVTENMSTKVRTAKVLVMAGGASESFEITQSESDIVIITTPDKFNVNQWGGEFEFEVQTNSQDWTVSSDASWLTVTKKPYKNEAVLNIKENKRKEARSTKIIVKSNDSSKELEVVQDGTMYYILPLLKVQANKNELDEFEFARRSTLDYSNSSPFGSHFTYKTHSPVFKHIRYAMLNGLMDKAHLYTENIDIFKETDFINFMRGNGFDVLSEGVFFNSDRGIKATVKSEDLEFTFLPSQPGPMPTYENFPYGYLDFTASLDKVKEWEAANGGTFENSLSNVNAGFYYYHSPEPWLGRSYIFANSPVLRQTANFIVDVDKFYYKFKNSYYFTKEFEAKLKSEGFTEVIGEDNGLVFYKNTEKNLALGIGVKRYTILNNSNPLVEMRFSLPETVSPNRTDVNPLDGFSIVDEFQPKGYIVK